MNFEHHKLFLSLSLEVLAVVPFRHYPSKSNNANVPISGRPTTAVASNGGRSIWRNRWSHCSFFTNKIISQESVLPCLGTSVALSPCKITVSRAGVSATLSGHQRSTESVHAEPMWSHKWTNWTSRENLWRNEDNETPADSDGPPNWCVDQHRSFATPTVNLSWTIRKPILNYSLPESTRNYPTTPTTTETRTDWKPTTTKTGTGRTATETSAITLYRANADEQLVVDCWNKCTWMNNTTWVEFTVAILLYLVITFQNQT